MRYLKINSYKICLVLCLVIWACSNPFEKNVVLPTQKLSQNSKDSTLLNNTKISENCSLISYSDTLVYFKNQSGDYKMEPLVRRDGSYGGIPEGLEINESNGEINVTKSESGLKYKVFFIPKNTSDTCFTSLTISGIDYKSKIYILDQGDSLAIPIYNSNANFTVPGGRQTADGGSGGNSGSGSSGSGSGSSISANSGSGSSNSGKSGGSEFDDDDDDDDGDGTADEPLPGQQVIPQGVAIDKANGKIALKKSLRNGLFGTNPSNGTTKKFKIYYRLDDPSDKALNAIEVQFHYFTNPGDIPIELKNSILEKNQSTSKGRIAAESVRKPRPPDIVIVGRYQ